MRDERIKWLQQLILNPMFRAVHAWPEPPGAEDLDAEESTLYRLRILAVSRVVEFGEAVSTACAIIKRSENELYRLLDRCLGSADGEEPMLKLGLLPNERIKPYERTASSDGREEGFAGSFSQLQRAHPELFEELREKVQWHYRRSQSAGVLTDATLHNAFKTNLLRCIPDSQYPFNTRDVAKESLRLWRKQVELELQLGKPRDQSRVNALMFDRQLGLMDAFVLDAHRQDVNFGGVIYDGKTYHAVRIARIWTIVTAEWESSAPFGLSWGFSGQERQEDILDSLEDATRPWEPYKDLPPGLKYPDDGGAPSIIPEFRWAIPYGLLFDNSWAHHSKIPFSYLHRAWRAWISAGKPRQSIARRIIEMVCARLAKYERLFPSTTGNNPFDPVRDPHPSMVPLVPVTHMPLIFDVVRAELCAERRADRFGQSPLGVLRNHLASGIILRKLPEEYRSPLAAQTIRRTFAIKGHDIRGDQLHVNWAYGRYVGPDLAKVVRANGRKVTVDIYRKDIRKLAVIGRNGKPEGELTLQGPWALIPHDERLRTEVYRWADEDKANRKPILSNYLGALTEDFKGGQRIALRFWDIVNKVTPELAKYSSSSESSDHSGEGPSVKVGPGHEVTVPQGPTRAFPWIPLIDDGTVPD